MNSTQKSPLESLSEAEWATPPSNVQAVMHGLVDENRQLKLTIAKPEDHLRRNSQDSSQPPSQDTAAQKAIQKGRRRSGRQRGGQLGHVGRGRALVPVEAVDNVVVHRPVAYQACIFRCFHATRFKN